MLACGEEMTALRLKAPVVISAVSDGGCLVQGAGDGREFYISPVIQVFSGAGIATTWPIHQHRYGATLGAVFSINKSPA